MAVTEEAIADIIHAFAGAALDPDQWLPAMNLMCDTTGAVCCALELTDVLAGTAVMKCTVDFDDKILNDYNERIFHINPRVTAAMDLPVGFVCDEHRLDCNDDPNMPEFRDWLSQTPYYYIQGGKILDSSGHVGFFTSNYSKKHGPGSELQAQIHRALFPHLVNFVEVGRALSSNKLQNELLKTNALDQGRPFALLDRAGRLIECSLGFGTVVGQKQILAVRDRCLVAIYPQHRRKLAALLNSALKAGGLPDPPVPIRLVGPDCHRGVVIRAVPIAPSNEIFDIFRPAALITLTDLDEPLRVRRGELLALFGLTEREADVAALISEGRSATLAAHQLGISEYTVRQHLKAVFGKIGVARQSELVSIVSRLV